MRSVGLAVALFVGCGGGGGDTPKDAAIDAMPPDPRTVVATVPASPNPNLDLLLVIDDSMNMASKQARFAAGLPALLDALGAIEGGLPSLHVGVVTTDLGTLATTGVAGPPLGTPAGGGCADVGEDGRLLANGAPLETGATFVRDIKLSDGTRLTNYTGTLEAVLGQMVSVGAGGCGFEQPLHAMKRALQNPANAGFLRPEAKLGIVFLTDEDDCSVKNPQLFTTETTTLGPVSGFRCTRFGVRCEVGGANIDEMNTPGMKEQCGPNRASSVIDEPRTFTVFLRGVKPDERDVFAAGIVGSPSPFAIGEVMLSGKPQSFLERSCTIQEPPMEDVAFPAPRMTHFFDLLDARGHWESMCSTDLTQPLAGVGRFAALAMGNACITHELAMPLDCIVEDDTGTMKTAVPACGSPETAPCWKIEIDSATCPTAQHQKLVVVRGAAPPPSNITTMRCKL